MKNPKKAECEHCRDHETNPMWEQGKKEALRAGKALVCALCKRVIMYVDGPRIYW